MANAYLNNHYFAAGMMDGMPIGQSDYRVPWLLQNCYIDRGTVRTRKGHTLVYTSASTPILCAYYVPAIMYACINDTVMKMGWFTDSTTFVAKNVYSTGTATVSGSTMTLTGAADLTKLLPPGYGHKVRYQIASVYTAWQTIASVDSTATMTLGTSPGNASGVVYQIAIGGGETSYGKMVAVGNRYIVATTGGGPMILDRLTGYCWAGGIPIPNAPTGSFNTATTVDAGWYGYKIIHIDKDGNKSSNASAALVVEATASLNEINLYLSYQTYNSGSFTMRPQAAWYEIYRTAVQVSAEVVNGLANSSYYRLGRVPFYQGVTMKDVAIATTVDTGTALSVGSTWLGTPRAPTGAFTAPAGDTGWFAYAITQGIPSNEEGMPSPRLIVEKSTSTYGIVLTFPALLSTMFGSGNVGYGIYRSGLKSTRIDAETAPLYKIWPSWGITTWEDNGQDYGAELGAFVPAPWEALMWGATTADLVGLTYIDGRVYTYGDDNYVRVSGAVDKDISGRAATGLDEPNWWNNQYQVGAPSDEVKAVVEYQNNVYALKANGVYALDRTGNTPDFWYFMTLNEATGCGSGNCAAAGVRGVYSIHVGTDGIYRIVRIMANGQYEIMSQMQGTMDSVTAAYCVHACGGKIYFSTDQGLVVYDEPTDTFRVDTGVTFRCMFDQAGIVYGGDATGKIYSLYSKAAGTAGDEGAYTWTVRSGAFRRDIIHPCGANAFWVRFDNDSTSDATVTAKFSVNGYTSYVQNPATSADWSSSITVTASTNDFLKECRNLPQVKGNVIGLQLSGTGTYGKLALVGYGVDADDPSMGRVGELVTG